MAEQVPQVGWLQHPHPQPAVSSDPVETEKLENGLNLGKCSHLGSGLWEGGCKEAEEGECTQAGWVPAVSEQRCRFQGKMVPSAMGSQGRGGLSKTSGLLLFLMFNTCPLIYKADVGQVLSWGCTRGNHILMFSLPLFLLPLPSL